ncbi:MAG: hypothetical protein GF393_09480 [Armatimonadia bacterium]|nr:hypothetical protein [Armatimonadia bacterium]
MRPQDIFGFIIYVAVGIYLIVEAESVGQFTGFARGHMVTSTTPGCMIRFFGCMLLALGPGLIVGGLVAWWLGVLVGLALAIGVYILANRLLPM